MKKASADYASKVGAGISAPEVVSSLNDYGSSAGILADPSFGSEYVFNPATTTDISAAALNETKFVVAYRDSGNYGYGTAIIGDITGNTITYGSEYVFNIGNSDYERVAALSPTKFAVSYQDLGNASYGTAVIGDVTGNSIAYGSEYVFNSATTDDIFTAPLSETKFAVAYRDAGNSNYGTAIIGDVTTNTIAYGSEYVFNTAVTQHISLADLSGTKFAVAYQDAGNYSRGTAIIGDVTTNTIAYGSEYVFNPAITQQISVAGLSGTKFAVAYRDDDNSYYGTAIIGDVTTNTIAYGSEYVFNTEVIQYTSAAALSETRFAVAYQDGDSSNYGAVIIGDVTGNTIAYGSEDTYNSAETNEIFISGLSGNKFAVVYQDYGNSSYGTATIGSIDPPTVLTAPATAITTSSATLNGDITSIGGEDCDQRGFRYREQGTDTWLEWYESAGPYSTGAYDHAITGFEPDTTYEFKAMAHNPVGWDEGDILTFATKAPAPHLTLLSPRSGVQGAVITITGTAFGAVRGTSYLKFGAVKATNYVSWSDTQIVAKVPAGAAGALNVSVTTAGGRSNLLAFKVIPRISRLSPLSGTPGTQVTITGNGFGARRGTSTVKFGITPVTRYISWSNNQIVVKVPATGTGAKLVKVTTSGGTSAGASFTVK